ncbi:hypothetical protein C8F04DRAFT_1078222 [Mycena alexandri]|uniref:HTH cro/C1-type domain-containing protein n=1 Tax=Mycena alexandri TaxID=1745969 RepID=A0AAD6TAL4_9AGAR|nr:hypothetical protein C8F04DRAFT_1078222 [Mycena alexandri]
MSIDYCCRWYKGAVPHPHPLASCIPSITMAPNPQCSALAAAKDRSAGLSYSDIAGKIGKSEQHVIDICTGTQRPTTEEFNALAKALGIQSQAPAISAHTTK